MPRGIRQRSELQKTTSLLMASAANTAAAFAVPGTVTGKLTRLEYRLPSLLKLAWFRP